ncbi:hypothetical protein [Streptomyces fodineus]|nr:hypothetical protein [Streptomyces fodineus]
MLISFGLRHLEDQPVAVHLCGPHPDAGANPRIRSNPYTTSLDATVRPIVKLATPQPFATATRPLNRPTMPPDAHCSVIASTFTPEQVRMLADTGNPVFEPMAAMDLRHLPTGHWPMFSRPIELASLLDEIAR